jgi:hypothetical protein
MNDNFLPVSITSSPVIVSPAFFTKADGLIPPTVSALPALAGLPTLTVYALPPDGVTVKLPAEPLANV